MRQVLRTIANVQDPEVQILTKPVTHSNMKLARVSV
jgi:hypothetical protein